MTLSKSEREKNNETALKLMFEDLGDDPINLRMFQSNDPRYEKTVDRTTWEDLTRNDYVSLVVVTEGARIYRLTPKVGYCVSNSQALRSPRSSRNDLGELSLR